MPTAFIGLGSNIGNRKQNLELALNYLAKQNPILKLSSFYETKPIGYTNQPDFVNAVVKVDTHLSPQQLLNFLQETENQLGRIREIKNGPRTIDLDLLFYEALIINQPPELILPHPRLHLRSFVLEPLHEIVPHFTHPVIGKTVSEMLKNLR